MTKPSRITFVTCLLAAPILYAIVPALFVLGGDYLARFGRVGNVSLFFSLPAWLTVFAYLAWRAANRREQSTRPYVMAALAANAASLAIIPLILFILEGLGANLSGMLHESFEQTKAMMEENGTEPTELPFATAILIAGFAAFFVGLFVMPILAALFAAVARVLKLEQPS